MQAGHDLNGKDLQAGFFSGLFHFPSLVFSLRMTHPLEIGIMKAETLEQ
jgi:hypothetical protein